MTPSLRVLPTRPFFAEDIAWLRARLAPGIELLAPPDYAPQTLADWAAKGVDAWLGTTVTADMFARAPGLRLIQIPWTGVDTLDFDLLRKFRVPVCNSHSNAGTVAEYAVSLLLAMLKSIPRHDAGLRQGKWSRPSRDGAGDFQPPRRLPGRVVGYAGYGAIAQAMAKMIAAFGARQIAIANRERATEPPLEWLRGPEALKDLLAEADILVIALPLTRRTRGLLDANALGGMKPGSFLVNISRGEVVDEAALYEALASGRLGGAAIDTWYQYPTAGFPDVLPSGRFPFEKLGNLVMSPHRAGFVEGELPHLADAAENLNRLAAGRPLLNQIDLEAQY